MKIALIVIATGKTYREYAKNLCASARKFMPEHDQIVFSDGFFGTEVSENYGGTRVFSIIARGYPQETLYRYYTMTTQRELLMDYDLMYYVDADMEFIQDVGDIFPKKPGLVATLHPGFVMRNPQGAPERRRESTAYCDHNVAYFCGGFQGGTAREYLAMAHELAVNVERDWNNGITAKWHDESHWNRYLADHPPVKVLTPSYCYPEGYRGEYGWPVNAYKPVLLAIDKKARGNHWSQQ